MAKKKRGLEGLKQDLENGTFKNTYAENLRKKIDNGNIKSVNVENNTGIVQTTTNNTDIVQTTTQKKKNTTSEEIAKYTDTGKTIGNYIKNSSLSNSKIYSKDNKYYYYDEKNKKYEEITNKTGYDAKKTNAKGKQIAPVSEHYTNQKSKLQANTGKYEETQKVAQARDDTLGLADRLKVDLSNKSDKEKKQEEKKLVQEAKDNSRVMGAIKGLEKNGYLNTEAFDDGYQFGDVSKTAISTILGGFNEIGRGAIGRVDDLSDFVNYGIADVQEILGDKKGAESRRKFADEFSLTDKFTMSSDEAYGNSLLGEKSNSIVNSIGGTLTDIATSGLSKSQKVATAIGNSSMFASSYGSGVREARQSGATDDEARKYGLISGVANVATESMFGGLGKGTKALGFSHGVLDEADEMLAQKIAGKFSSQLAKNLTEYTIKAGAEGVEEIAAGLLEGIGKKLTYESEKDLSEIIKDEQLLDRFIGGVVASAALQVPGLVKSTKSNRDLNTGLTQNEQKVFDSVSDVRYNEALNERENLSNAEKKKLKTEIETQVKEDLENGNISINEINKALGGETYQNYENANKQKANIQSQIDELNNTRMSDMSYGQYNEINSKITNLQSQLEKYNKNPYEQQLNQEMAQKTANDYILQRSYEQENKKGQVFTYETNSKDSDLTKNVYQSAIDSGANDTKKMHDLADFVAKISNDTGIQFEFTTTERLRNLGYNITDNTVINGLNTTDGKVLINLDAKNVLNKVIGHELLHLFENTSYYSVLQEQITEYAKSKGEYDSRRAELEKNYQGIEANIDNELTSDLVGEYIFGDEKFIESLSKDKNIFQKTYDKIKHLYNVATAGSKEKRQLEKAKRTFEKIYQNNKAQSSNETKFSIQKDSNGNKYVNIDTDQDIFKGKNLYEQNKIAKQYILDNFRGKELSINDENVSITRTTANEYTHPRTTLQKKDASSKMKASTELDNLLSISEYKYSKPDDGRHSFAKDGWDYYETTFKVGNNIYTGLVNIAKNGDKKMLYDITNLKRNTLISSSVNTATESIGIPFSDTNVSQSNIKVKSDTTNNSMQNSKNDTKGLENSSFYSDKTFNSKSEISKEIQNLYSKIYKDNNYSQEEKNTFRQRVKELKELRDNFKAKQIAPVKETYKQAIDKLDDVVNTKQSTKEIQNIADKIINDINTSESISQNAIDEYIENSDIFTRNQIEESEYLTDNEISNYNSDLFDKVFNKVNDIISEDGITLKDEKYSRNEKATKGWNELLNYFYKNNIKYEISHSTNAGYVPSIYVKDSDGNTVYRIANHDNGYVDDFDMVYDNAYNTIFKDKDYINWKENILPKVEKEIGTTNDISLEQNAKQYNDLIKTNYIEFFRKDNGDVKVSLIDTNNNLVNDFSLWSNTQAINELGERLGNQIYETATDITKKINIGNDINNLGTETDYFMNHRPTNAGITADNLLYQGEEISLPKDIYEHPEYYFQMKEKYSQESMEVVRSVRGKPNAEVTIYRATPGNKINAGDWVTFSKEYAKYHNYSQFDNKANIIEMKVKAKDVQFAGDDINEWGYFPQDKYSLSNKNDKATKKSSFDISSEDVKVNKPIAPTNKSITPVSKTLNPIEISRLTPEDANTTPKLAPVKIPTGNGESHFYDNIKDKVNMLSEDSKAKILSEDEVKYYRTVTNEDSLNKAFKRLNDGGANETLSWMGRFRRNEKGEFDVSPTPVDVAEGWILLKQYNDIKDYDGAVQVVKILKDIGTVAGQTVQAFNIMNRMTPEGMVKYAQSELTEAYDNMVKNKSQKWINENREKFDLQPGEVQFILDTMQEVSKMQDGYDKRVKLAEIQKLMTDKLPPAKGQGIKSWMRISMLFNPKTQVRNVAGNALIAPINYFGDMFSSYADKLIAKKTNVRTTGNMNVKAILKGMKEGAYQATNDYKKGINTKDMEGNRFEISEAKSFDDNKLVGRYLNKTEALLNYVMDAGDRVFSQSSFENSLQNQMILNNTDTVTQDMIDIARTESLQRTWNDNNNYTKFVLDVRRGLNKIGINGYGLGDILIPFAKTPANLTKAIVDYSPAGLVNTLIKGKNLKNSIETGQFTPKMQHEFVQSLGKATAGSMLYVLGYALAKSGVISGESDDDKDVSNFMKNTLGISSYSIKIGDKSFTYDWAQPLAAPLSIMSNIVNSKDNQGQALLEGIVGSLDSAGSILLEQSFLTSINDVLSDNDDVISGLINETLQLPARAVPTFSKQIADLTDGTQRTSYEYGKPLETALNSIKAKIPGLSKTLAPTVDTLGREVQKYGGKNNVFNVMLNPANVNSDNISESAEEIYRVYKQTGDNTVMPKVAPYYVNSNGEKIMLTSKQRAKFQKKSGELIGSGVASLMKTDSYQNASDIDKASMINGIVDYSYHIAQHDTVGTDISQTYQKAYNYTNDGGDIANYYIYKNDVADMSSSEKTEYLYNSSFDDSEKTLLYEDVMLSNFDDETKYKNYKTAKKLGIDINSWLNYSSQGFESSYDSNGNTVKNSKKNSIINFVKTLDLSTAQKAALIKMNYSSYTTYDSQIMKEVNSLGLDFEDKAKVVKTLGFSNYDKSIINYVKNNYSDVEERSNKLKELGFTVYKANGRTYVK